MIIRYIHQYNLNSDRSAVLVAHVDNPNLWNNSIIHIGTTDLNHIEFRVQTRFKIAKAMLEAASAVAEEIRKYLTDTPIDEKKLRIKTLNEIKELINEK